MRRPDAVRTQLQRHCVPTHRRDKTIEKAMTVRIRQPKHESPRRADAGGIRGPVSLTALTYERNNDKTDVRADGASRGCVTSDGTMVTGRVAHRGCCGTRADVRGVGLYISTTPIAEDGRAGARRRAPSTERTDGCDRARRRDVGELVGLRRGLARREVRRYNRARRCDHPLSLHPHGRRESAAVRRSSYATRSRRLRTCLQFGRPLGRTPRLANVGLRGN